MTNLRQVKDEDLYPNNPGKRFKIKRFIDNLPSGIEFAPSHVAKTADLTTSSAARYLQQYEDVICLGRGRWKKI